jgi:hypothetical protein
MLAELKPGLMRQRLTRSVIDRLNGPETISQEVRLISRYTDELGNLIELSEGATDLERYGHLVAKQALARQEARVRGEARLNELFFGELSQEQRNLIIKYTDRNGVLYRHPAEGTVEYSEWKRARRILFKQQLLMFLKVKSWEAAMWLPALKGNKALGRAVALSTTSALAIIMGATIPEKVHADGPDLENACTYDQIVEEDCQTLVNPAGNKLECFGLVESDTYNPETGARGEERYFEECEGGLLPDRVPFGWVNNDRIEGTDYWTDNDIDKVRLMTKGAGPIVLDRITWLYYFAPGRLRQQMEREGTTRIEEMLAERIPGYDPSRELGVESNKPSLVPIAVAASAALGIAGALVHRLKNR